MALTLLLKASAQTSAEFRSLVQVSTVSPNSASLGKFGNIPVSYVTGIPSVTIPLYEVTAGAIKLPLSLDYHGGGVRVDELASSVGTSWALSGIPEITRSMVGLPDEGNGGYLSAVSLDSLFNYYSGVNYSSDANFRYAQFIYNVRDNLADTEPDVFSYSLNGSSGKFIYRPNGTIMQIPVTNNRIEKLSGNNFKITDQKGVTYIYDQQEATTMITASATVPYATTWKVSKIIDPSMADTVYFKYTANSGTIERSFSYTYTLGNKLGGNSEAPTETIDATGEAYSMSQMSHASLFLNEIDWRGGKVTLKNTQDRTDRSTELRLDSVKVYSRLNGAYQLIKDTKLNQSYFYSNPVPGKTPDYRNYRLRLDSVTFFPVNSTLPPQKYSMTYNNTPIAPNESFGQDIWGYNNGQYGNPTLMPKQTVLWQGAYRLIGEANMDADSTNTFVQACMLQSIKYPTKGTSVFAFEPHRYPLDYQTTQLQSIYCDAYGSVQTTNSTTFTVAANQTAFRYSATLSAYNYPGVTSYPEIKMVDQTTGQTVFLVNNVGNPSQSYSVSNIAITLVAGHTYVITTNIYSTDSRVQATCTVSWSVPVPGTIIRCGGGLRVSSITNYDNNGNFINKENYQYNGDGVGKLLTGSSYLAVNYDYLFYSMGYSYGIAVACAEAMGDIDVVYHAKSVYPATQCSGSPVLYNGVTKYDVDANGNPNGKSVFGYPIYDDQAGLPSTDYGSIGIWLINNSWKNGFMASESIYKSSGSGYSPVSIKNFNYSIYRRDTLLGLKIKPTYIKQGGCEVISGANNNPNTRYGAPNSPGGSSHTHFFIGRVPTYTGAMLLQSESDTTFDDAGNKFVTVKNNYYNDLTHIFPTKTETFNSRNETLTNVIKYPHDLASGTNVYQKMLTRNIVSPTVKFQQLKNGSQLALANINYNDWFGNNNLLLPQTVDEQVLSAPIETRTKFNKYDAYGNILEQQKTNAPVSGYKWGYYSQYPIAVAANAASTEFYYEGFEESTAASVVAGTAHTGLRFYNGAYTVSWTRPNARNYVISYWYRNSSGVWQYQPEAAYTAGSYALTGGTAYDDIRIYPADAQMTSYTYLPLVGMTSSTDAKGMTTYYEYDGFQRLQNIKDQNGRILKNYDYNYASEAAVWVDNTGRRCKSGSTTGEQERQETDTNPLSVTYNQTRWVSNGINTTACPLPATVYVKQTVGSTSISNGLTYNTLKFNTYSDANCTVLVNAPVALTVNYSYVTSASYADGRTPNPVVTTTNATVTIAAGSNQATSGSIIISGCFGTADKQICYTPSTQITVQPGTGYIAVNPEI
ncbi:YD repeat-containing protein [Mucilaginibacter sp. OK283]|nr:YD repeat-containing protein [Mucilaginibacter sp. OK283]